jgi:hypothetical protein
MFNTISNIWRLLLLLSNNPHQALLVLLLLLHLAKIHLPHLQDRPLEATTM